MHGSDESNQTFIKICRRHGLKATPQRMAIYMELLQYKNHPTVDDVYQSIRRGFPYISFDTVNRTMRTFVEIGLVETIESYSGARRYDPNVESHHHVHCVRCGKIVDFWNKTYDELDVPVEISSRYKIVGKRVVINVICAECHKNSN